ncbi:hypothetical protein AKJ49_01995 [candidate division MSBL1 archaeon SCGC-AAA382A03]|uniref:LUD domain-containing protein n=1 Tax=candidate division MSBL1 archaeon SCGC-AAA382A03 TaxID=1698278 RepID=A0A133VDM6_9EURY|nr:hypothetical protein AKJ49_01995 [candidate division MSBL1 archaeon SCGC-AAA382A03]
MDERELREEKKEYHRRRAEKVVENLKRKHIDAFFVQSSEDGLEKIIELIPDQGEVGIGDSMTLHQIEFIDWLEKQECYRVFNSHQWTQEGNPLHDDEERFKLMRKALVSDVFLSSVNAVTMDGKLVNVDGHGNRAAAMVYGPAKTILVAGVNKIVKDIDQAMKRIKDKCAPLNAIRHFKKHNLEKLPCIVEGTCQDCQSPERICRKTVIVNGQSPSFFCGEEKGITAIIIGEHLGI